MCALAEVLSSHVPFPPHNLCPTSPKAHAIHGSGSDPFIYLELQCPRIDCVLVVKRFYQRDQLSKKETILVTVKLSFRPLNKVAIYAAGL